MTSFLYEVIKFQVFATEI